ncbi:MAG: aspartate aminotransferase family protein [Chitinophagaceae bacterium]|nr:MAG: aspartate aminotransferase family protein [Chitinophagaceae bacterium]
MTNREIFLRNVAQTSEAPLCLEIIRAEGCKLFGADGSEYIDLIGGISVCNVGHRHPKVIDAIKAQLDQYLHIMVYGELVQSPQVKYAQLLTQHLPENLNSVFFTASGSEATEGAMKLAKRYSNRTQIISFKNSYHGSTQGALSVMGSEYWQQAFRPLLPDVLQLKYNHLDDLQQITERTACVIAETIQAEAGVNPPKNDWLKALRKRCDETGTLLVLDEIQCGFGRNGTLWAFEQFGVVPDILLLGKALGGGMPLGAFIADKKIMDVLSYGPVLEHINTFGGHPVCCAAGLAAFHVLLDEQLVNTVKEKEQLFVSLLTQASEALPVAQRPVIRSCGLMIAVAFENFEKNKQVIDGLLKATAAGPAVFTDWFLFAANCLRIAPPLTISADEIRLACKRIAEQMLLVNAS